MYVLYEQTDNSEQSTLRNVIFRKRITIFGCIFNKILYHIIRALIDIR